MAKLISACLILLTIANTAPAEQPTPPAVEAVDFASAEVYRSTKEPGYTSWVSFFPGEKGQWYLTCEEVSKPDKPLPKATREQFYAMGLPAGYDKSQYQMEMVILESTDDMKTWHVISRQPCRFQHSAGSFGQARTRDGRFLRFVWSVYSLDPKIKPNEILYESRDNGKTWIKREAFHDSHFISHPHRLRTLRDGTLVLALPLGMKWGPGTDRPLRTCSDLDAPSNLQMHLCFSFDQGRTWTSPLPIYAGQQVSETDFVELPSGDLLCINNSIFGMPGRQIIYREGNRFTPGPFQRVKSGMVPETVALTEDGILVGCLRNSSYHWSDDLGRTWQPLNGAKKMGKEMYQPWINYLGHGKFACAGHYGYDDAIEKADQYLMIHTFTLKVNHRTLDTHLSVVRDFDQSTGFWPNSYTITLDCGGKPLPDKELTFWYVLRDQPGFDSWNVKTIEERMKLGGTIIEARTGPDGKARVSIPELDKVREVHSPYQFVVLFNADRADKDYKPAQSPQFTQHAYWTQDPPPSAARISVREGRFVEKTSGKPYAPLGVNYYRVNKPGQHATFSPAYYDRAFIEEMMDDVAARGFNTIRTFQCYTVGEDGIVTSPQAREISPAYLDNVIHFLEQARKRHLHVIFTWDAWNPGSEWLSSIPLPDESKYHFLPKWDRQPGPNSFRIDMSAVRTRANCITELIKSIKQRDPGLLPVVMSWELENEVYFTTAQPPLDTREGTFDFGGKTYNLASDDEFQALMDAIVSQWSNALTEAVRKADPEALVGAPVYTFAAVGRTGPGTLSKDTTKDPRIPARPMALLKTGIDYLDIHLYAWKSDTETVGDFLARSLASDEFDQLQSEAREAGKPIVSGEIGVFAHYLRKPDLTIDHTLGVQCLREHLTGINQRGIAGVLYWPYGNPDSKPGDETPPIVLFPQYADVLHQK